MFGSDDRPAEVGDLVIVSRCIKLPESTGIVRGESEVTPTWIVVCEITDPANCVHVPPTYLKITHHNFKK